MEQITQQYGKQSGRLDGVGSRLHWGEKNAQDRDFPTNELYIQTLINTLSGCVAHIALCSADSHGEQQLDIMT
jgi:hypothetical protein